MPDTIVASGQIATTDGQVLPVVAYTDDAYPHVRFSVAIVPAQAAPDPADRAALLAAMRALDQQEPTL